MRARAWLAVSLVGAVGLDASLARAEEPEAHVTADDVTLDARSQALSLRGHVRIDAPPFNMTSDQLRVTRTARGLVVDGNGRVAFCPCLGEPLALSFRAATVAPPGDLFLTRPVLEVEGLPVFWLPYFWLRSAGRPGLLPPEIAYRGQDGLFLGEGVHLPWQQGDLESGVDLRAGAYVKGGAAVETTLRTPTSTTLVRWDHLGTDGLSVDARGSIGGGHGATLSWDGDLVRGARGVVATTDLDAAARVFDRASAESSWHGGGWVLATGVWAENIRGSGLGKIDAAGPVVRARVSDTVGTIGSYDTTLEGGLATGAGLPALSYARGDTGTLLATRWGPVGASMALRGGGDVLNDGQRDGYDAAASARGRLALPVGRAFNSSEPDDPWRHLVEPRIEVAALAAQSDDLLGEMPTPGGLSGLAWFTGGGVDTSVGRWGARNGLELGGAVGAVGGNQEASTGVVRWRGAATTRWFGMGAEGADVFGASTGWGHAMSLRARVGPLSSVNVGLLAAGRDGVDPVVARLLTDAPLASSVGFLAAPGWTTGGRVGVPITRFVTARGGVDGDLTARRLVAARGSLEVHDHCGCVALRLSVAERLGREGVDVWMSVDLVRR